jgi:hypothetical protein
VATEHAMDGLSLSPGSEIEVRTRFDNRWVGGFEIAARERDSYLLRRRSDQTVLPIAFSPQEVRPRGTHS